MMRYCLFWTAIFILLFSIPRPFLLRCLAFVPSELCENTLLVCSRRWSPLYVLYGLMASCPVATQVECIRLARNAISLSWTPVHMSHHHDEEDKDERREGMTTCDILN